MGDSEIPVRPLTRQDLAACTERLLRRAAGAKPAILLVRWGTRRLIVKDFSQNAWVLRHIYGRWVVATETRIYAHLEGVEGVPTFRGRIDPFAFAVDYVEAPSLKAYRRKTLPAAVFDRLAKLQAELHRRGVVHLDSHQKRNILLTAGGQPWIVDFASSHYLGTGWLARKVLIPLLAPADRLGLQKLKARYCSEQLPPAERRAHRLRWTLGWLWPFTVVRRLRRMLRQKAKQRALRS